jgi:hypothetical protein
MMTPYYADDAVTIYHGDAREILPCLEADVMVTDPPYGIEYRSGQFGVLDRSIEGDQDTSLRDDVLDWWRGRPAIVFGSWRKDYPANTRMALVWDQDGALGMGALDLPWKPSWQMIFVLGKGFSGRRTGGVLRYPPVQSMARNGRTHPHEKPVPLMRDLPMQERPERVFDLAYNQRATEGDSVHALESRRLGVRDHPPASGHSRSSRVIR